MIRSWTAIVAVELDPKVVFWTTWIVASSENDAAMNESPSISFSYQSRNCWSAENAVLTNDQFGDLQ